MLEFAKLGIADVSTVNLTVETVNFYRQANLIVNYPGKSDKFVRGVDDPNVYTPPSKSGPPFKGLFIFQSRYGHRTVLYRNGVLYRVFGNKVKRFASFSDSASVPLFAVHNGLLIIIAKFEKPIVYDGELAYDLGCTEQPLPPITFPVSAPAMSELVTRGMWCFPNINWLQSSPISGPASNKRTEPDGTIVDIPGVYRTVVQYIDLFGNKGKASPMSNIAQIKARKEESAYNMYTFDFLVSDFSPPLYSKQVAKVLIGRTLNLSNEEDAQAAQIALTEGVLPGSTMHRYTHRMIDEVLSAQEQIDVGVFAIPSAEHVASWKGRLFCSDKNIVYWSDSIFFGQFRDEQSFKMKDDIVAIQSSGDRILVVSRTAYAVLYDSDGRIGVLEDSFPGSVYPKSFATVGASVIGLWSDGFYVFDGQQRSKIVAPELFENVDPDDVEMSAAIWNGYYILSAIYMQTERCLLMLDLETKTWFRVQESCTSLCVYDGRLFGVSDSLYELFVGKDWPAATVELHVAENPFVTKKWTSLRLFATPSSANQSKVSARTNTVESVSRFVDSLAAESQGSRELVRRSHWDEVGRTWDTVTWTSDIIGIEPMMSNALAGNYIVVSYEHTGSPIELLGLAFDPPQADGKAVR